MGIAVFQEAKSWQWGAVCQELAGGYSCVSRGQELAGEELCVRSRQVGIAVFQEAKSWQARSCVSGAGRWV